MTVTDEGNLTPEDAAALQRATGAAAISDALVAARRKSARFIDAIFGDAIRAASPDNEEGTDNDAA